MRSKIVIITIILLALGLSSAYAGNSTRIGTDGGQELLIPIGSRGTAMGGAALASASGVEALFWNPAGLADLDGTEVMFTHLPYLADIDVNYVGVGTYIDGFGSVGFQAKVVSIGEMEETTEAFPDGTGRIFEPSLSVLSLSYARVLTANVSFGATAQFIHEDVFEVSASGMAFDAGFKYDPRWKGLSLGLTIKNYGPQMAFEGRGFDRDLDGRTGRPTAASFELPSSLNLGVAYDFFDKDQHFATVEGNFRSNNFQEDFYQAGAEYVYDNKYSLRMGYNFSDTDAWLYGLSMGAGVIVDLGGTSLSFEYSWTETDTFDDNQYFTVKAIF